MLLQQPCKVRGMQRLIKDSCAIAAEEIGKEKAGRIADAAQKRYEELLAENAGDSKALKAHTFKRIYPSIAVYEAFQAEGIEPEKPPGISGSTFSVSLQRRYRILSG